MNPRTPQIALVGSLAATASLMLVVVLLALAPFAVTLEVHHALAAADQDGHQHSDSDLCQWIQHHTGSSLLAVLPTVGTFSAIASHDLPNPCSLTSTHFVPTGPPRAPPLS